MDECVSKIIGVSAKLMLVTGVGDNFELLVTQLTISLWPIIDCQYRSKTAVYSYLGMFLNLVRVMEHRMVLLAIRGKTRFDIICHFIQDFKKFKIANLERVQIGPLVCKKIQPQ